MRPRLLALCAVVFWGVSFVATKLALARLSPLTLIFLRALLGAALLAAILAARRARVPPRHAWPMLALMGFVGVAFHQLLQAHALTLTTASNTGWLIGVTPLWSALFAVLALRERISAAKALGLALGFAGTVLVVTGGALASFAALPSTRGDLLILLSTLNWAAYTVLGHGTLRRLGPAAATCGAMAAVL